MNSKRPVFLAALLAALLPACGGEDDLSSPEPAAATGAQEASAITIMGVTANLAVQSDWGQGYCARVTVANPGGAQVTSWSVGIALNQSRLTGIWGGTATVSGGRMTVRPTAANTKVPRGTTVSFNFCGAATAVANHLPVLTNFNVMTPGGGSGSSSSGSSSGGTIDGSSGSGSGGPTGSSSSSSSGGQ